MIRLVSNKHRLLIGESFFHATVDTGRLYCSVFTMVCASIITRVDMSRVEESVMRMAHMPGSVLVVTLYDMILYVV